MRIAVYCSAKNSIPEEYLQLGIALGTWLAEQGHTLVYGGATGGLMSVVSETVHDHGGKVIGVVPKRIVDSGRRAECCDELYLTESMSQRKQLMRSLSDCFICLPGSYGTLDEMYDVIASGTVGEHRKPIYILNYNDYYTPLIQLSVQMKQKGFLPEKEHYIPIFVSSLQELTDMLDERFTQRNN